MFYFHFLKEDEQLLVESFTRRWTINGPGTFFVSPLYRVRRRKGTLLGPTDYLLIHNTLTGEPRIERGPKLYFLTAEEQIAKMMSATTLRNDEYVRLLDKKTGRIRVERGEASVYVNPNEEIIDAVKKAVQIDEHTAVLVRDISTGQLSLLTESGVFFPNSYQEIVEIRRRILLEDHQVMVIRDKDGKYEFRRGTDSERSFFLDPYSEVMPFLWSSGIHKDKRSLKVLALDLRPKFMWYEFEARTQDNVELVIGITFFWQVVDVEAMVKTTDDTPGDICSHARSSIIQAISQVSLERFLASFNEVVRRPVIESNDAFYAERGVRLHAVEVRSIQCREETTQQVLNEIITEITNRLNRLQKQESENEVRLRQIQGNIEAEEARQRLLELQRANVLAEALVEGEAEARRVQAFLDGLGTALAAETKIAVFNLLRKRDILHDLSQGSAQLYFTPADVDLSIETRDTQQNGRAS